MPCPDDLYLDEYDRAILGIIQADFPLEKRPYEVIGLSVGLTEAETLARVRAMRGRGVIRRIGANFSSRHLGFVSTLCAAKVPLEKIKKFTDRVNAEPGVTHNYLRDHEYNIWFTVISPSEDITSEIIDRISESTGVSILNLPATRLYKIRVDFPMGDKGDDSGGV